MASIDFVLSLETSCDDTSVAVVDAKGAVLGLASANQDLVHEPFGGIVPELASRNHTLTILPLIDAALAKAEISWNEIQGIAVTSRPGLIGSLLVGVVTAKTFALMRNLPFIGINHLEGHIHAPFLRDSEYQPPANFDYPFVALTVSGGHTALYQIESFGRYKLLGQTVDDAAGEAFDKFAKMLGLPYPGGVHVDKAASLGRIDAHSFARPMINENNLDFSFSGLKSSGQRMLAQMSAGDIERSRNDLAASYQEAIVDVLIEKLEQACRKTKMSRAVITGGVSANSRLRARAVAWAQTQGVQLVIPPLRYCTDNAAMIGFAGIQRLRRGERSDLDLAPQARSMPTDFLETRPKLNRHHTGNKKS